MSKINEIQMKLGELSGGEFQKLMDEYFSKEYKGTVYPIGSALENNNTKTGTPDTLIKPLSEKYVYIEYTVQKNKVVSKFKDDISKCFDVKKTGIKKNLIGKIICCCNTRLATSEIEELVSIGRKNKIVVEVVSLDTIAYKLIKFPFLIKDSLGISIDTQQILEIEDFVKINDSAKLATPLNIDIFGREGEIESILKLMNEEQIVLISGLPGVGKTRLSIEIMKLFKEQHSEYKLKCLRNNGQNIYDDLNLYFSEAGSYLLMIDDANLLTNFQLILDLFSWESKGVKIKLILTVREYAEEKIKDKISNYNFNTFKIKPLNEEHIELLCKYLNVSNTRYIERINEIAKGNPRLAIMACATAKKENCLSSLSNVVDIVESYYRNIKSYFEKDLQNSELLRVGALLSFLNHVNIKDDENLEMLCSFVNQDKETFVENIYKLHSMEIVDVHENELVKISDQILSIYIFYLSVFKKKDLSYKKLIDRFYPSLKGRIVENLNNVFSYFYKEENLKIVKDAIKEIYEEQKNNFETEDIESFLITFWFTLEIEGLLYAKNKIENYENNTIKEIRFEIKNNNNYSNILKLLACYNNSKYYLDAIELILLYLEKKPTEFSSVFKILTDNYGFDEKSDIYGYVQELELLKKIEQSYDLKKNDLYTNLLIKFLEYYLRFSYEHTKIKGTRSVIFSRIPVYLENNLPEIREKIWGKLREFSNQNICLYKLHEILYNYGRNSNESFDIEILKFDKVFVESIVNDIKEVTLEQSIVFNRLKNFFERNGVYFIDEVVKKIETKEYLIYLKIFNEPRYNDKDRLAEEKELIDWCTSLVDEDFYKVFRIYNKVVSIDYMNSKFYNSGKRMETLFLNISINEKLNILERFFEENVRVNLHPMKIIKKVKDLNKLEESILKVEFFNKSYWLYCIYREISFRNSNNDLLQKIYDYFNQPEGDVAGYSRDITFLKSFIEIDENVFTTVINSLLKQEDIVVLRSLETFLLHTAENEEYITIYLKNDLNLLKTIYLRLLNIRQYFDYDSSILKVIVRRNPNILKEILESILEDEKTTYKFNEEINLTFIWNEENWFELADLVSEVIKKYTHKKEKYYAVKDLLEKLVLIDSNSSKESKENLYKWIELKIIEWAKDEELTFSLFECLNKFGNNIRIGLIINLMKIKPSFKFFKRLPLSPRSYSWSGSEVPVLREQQLFYQQLMEKVEGIQFLEHKQWLKENIDHLEKRIKKVKIRELTEDL